MESKDEEEKQSKPQAEPKAPGSERLGSSGAKDDSPRDAANVDAEDHGEATATNYAKNALTPKSQGSAYKERRKKKRRKHVFDDDSDDESTDEESAMAKDNSDDDDDDVKEVSLNDLKRKVMGRDLREHDEDEEEDEELQQVRDLMTHSMVASSSKSTGAAGSRGSDGAAQDDMSKRLADKLRQDLTCSVCHDIVYPPVSLACGHSFCQPCIQWWLDQASSCPTCRQDVLAGNNNGGGRAGVLVSTNVALRACVIAVYGHDIVQRLKAMKQQHKGEQEGQHDAGYQVLSTLEDESWRQIQVLSRSQRKKSVQTRRSIVLDADDQRMQLALALYEQPEKTYVDDADALKVRLCLLSMEEDEAEVDGGFPTCVMTPEDERLICNSHNGNRFEFCQIGVQRKDDQGDTSPLARVTANANGIFEYVWDQARADDEEAAAYATTTRALVFVHTESGAQLEVVLPMEVSCTDDVKSKKKSRPALNDDDEEDDGDHLDHYENDGFLVADGEEEDDEEEEGQFSDDVGGETELSVGDNGADECGVCHDGGDLMLCDGGDHLDGCCGRPFHAECVGRSSIPSGDWICQDCARTLGGMTDVGSEGHEFPATRDDDNGEASDDGRQPKEVAQRVIIGNEDDDDDDNGGEEGGDGGKRKKESDNEGSDRPRNIKRRRVIEDSDSD